MRIRIFSSLTLVLPILGCSNHPLPDRVTHYTSAQLVEKLRCEAQDAVLFHIGDKGWRRAQDRILIAQKWLADFTIYKLNNKDAFNLIKEFKLKIKERKNEINKRRAKLLKRLEHTNTIRKTINEIVKKDEVFYKVNELSDLLKKLRLQDYDNFEKEILNKRFDALKKPSSVLLFEIAAIDQQLKKEEDFNSKVLIKNKNILIKKHGISYDKIKKSNKREQEALKILGKKQNTKLLRDLFLFNDNAIALNLQFDITESNNATANLKLKWPKLSKLGFIGLDLSASKQLKRQATRDIKTVTTFLELSDTEKVECLEYDDVRHSRRARSYPLVGKVGIDEIIHQYVDVTDGVNIAGGGESFTDRLQFTTTIMAGFNPTIQLMKITPEIVSAGLDINVDRIDLHIVDVQLKPHSPSSMPPVPKLNITGFPTLRTVIEEATDSPAGRPVRIN